MNTPPNIFFKNEVNYIRLGLSTDIFKIKPWKARPNNDISTPERYKDYIYRVYATIFYSKYDFKNSSFRYWCM